MFMYGIIVLRRKFCDVHLLYSLMHHLSCCSLDADWGECIPSEFARGAHGKFYEIYNCKVNLFVNTVVR